MTSQFPTWLVFTWIVVEGPYPMLRNERDVPFFPEILFSAKAWCAALIPLGLARLSRGRHETTQPCPIQPILTGCPSSTITGTMRWPPVIWSIWS